MVFSCEENPFCSWFTYDGQTALCYLKEARGYLVNRNRTEGDRFTSGATFRDGCNPDPCEPPYSYQSHQCLHFYPVSTSFLAARETCQAQGGFLPFSYSGYEGGFGLEDSWHWVSSPLDTGDCYACRPARWSEGVRRVSCKEQLSFACEREGLYPRPTPTGDFDIIDLSPDNSLAPSTRFRPHFSLRPSRKFLRRRRPFRSRYNYIRNPYLAF